MDLSRSHSGIVLILIMGLKCTDSEGCQSSGGQWYFSQNPKSSLVTEGGTAFLECEASDDCNLEFFWELNSITIKNETRRYQQGKNLVIERVDKSLDAGEFVCVGRDIATGQSQHSQIAELAINWIGTNATVTPLDASTKDNVQLECSVEGSEEDMSIRWFHNGQRIRRKSAKNVELLPRTRSLLVRNPGPEDMGVYSCEADNSAGLVVSQENYRLVLEDGEYPTLKSISDGVVAKEGDSLTFYCEFENANSVSWSKLRSSEELPTTGRVWVSEAGARLSISKVERDDKGWYLCSAVGSSGKTVSYGVLVQIAFVRSFDKTLNFLPRLDGSNPSGIDYVVGISGTLEVICVNPPGHPAPKVWWERKSTKLPDHGRIRTVDGETLIIENVGKSDEGVYACVAENLAGRSKGLIKLRTSVKPKIVRHPGSKLADEHDNVTLRCRVEGTPYPFTSIRWEKDGKLLSANPYNTYGSMIAEDVNLQPEQSDRSFAYNEETGDLVLKSVNANAGGVYVCIVFTKGQDPVRSRPASVTVQEVLKFVPKPVDTKLELGKQGKLICRARGGQEKPQIRWFKAARILQNGTKIAEKTPEPFSATGKRIRSTNGTLFIYPVMWEDQGEYTCIASVPGQRFLKHTIKVAVYRHPRFTVEPKDQSVLAGDTARFDCVASGEPTPTIHWDRDGDINFDTVDIQSNSRLSLLPNKTLIIRNVTQEDAGVYGCGAGNKFAFNHKMVLLCVKEGILDTMAFCGSALGHREVSLRSNIEESGGSGSMHQTIAIACGAAIGYVLLVICLLCLCRLRRKQKLDYSNKNEESPNGQLLVAENGNIVANGFSPAPSAHTSDLRPSTRHSNSDKMLFSRELLAPFRPLGNGVFGAVDLMYLKQNNTRVVVKRLLNSDENVQARFAEEVALFSRISHPHVATLIGVCREELPLMMVLEYLSYGDLKTYMIASQRFQPGDSSYPPPLTLPQIVHLAHQISLGLECISNHRFVHKDIAARNINVSESLHAKISSLSLSSDAFANDYYTYRHVVQPLRWMPPEAIFDDDWSMKSDVWSFAICCWELLTCASMPYAHLSNEEVIERLKAHKTDSVEDLGVPEGCPTPLKQCLLQCWSVDSRNRPSVQDIVTLISALHIDTKV